MEAHSFSDDVFARIASDPLGWVDAELGGSERNAHCDDTSKRIQQAFWDAAFPTTASTASHGGDGSAVISTTSSGPSSSRGSSASMLPSLHAENIKSDGFVHNKAVTFRCIVQDMLDVEFYVARARSLESDGYVYLKYREFASGGTEGVSVSDGADEVILERLPLFCCPVPGESPWVQSLFDAASQAQAQAQADQRTGRKRALEDEAVSAMEEAEEYEELQSLKTQKVEENCIESSSISDITTTDARLGASVPPQLPGAIVKLYDIDPSEGTSPIRLNDMIEVVGVYSRENMGSFLAPLAAKPDNELIGGDPFGALEDFEGGMNRLKDVPVIHCVVFKKLCSAYPLFVPINDHNGRMAVEYNINVPLLQGRGTSDSSFDFASARSFVLERLTGALGGDALAAEYVMLSLISHVISRNADAAVGNLHLNLTDVSPNDPRIDALRREISNIVPRLISFRLDRDTLNDTSSSGLKLFLERDSSLLSSPLQCGPGTVFLVDETRMDAGAMTQGGLRSIHSLRSMIRAQTLPIAMEYCAGVEIPTDACVIIISNSSSIVDDSVLIRVRSPSTKFSLQNDRNGGVDTAISRAMREWWGRCRVSSAALSEDMISVVENDFVTARRADDDASVGNPYRVPNHRTEASTLHNWLAVSRLHATSQGSALILQPHWDYARSLEWRRLLESNVCVGGGATN